MGTNDIWDIIRVVASIGALVVSIFAIFVAGKREKDRKLKDVIIEEIASLQQGFLNYLTPIVNGESKYSCQQTISWFKFAVGKTEAINAYVVENLNIEKQSINGVIDEVQALRTYLTETEGFRKAYESPTYSLESKEIVDVERCYAKIYKAFLANISMVNSSKRR